MTTTDSWRWPRLDRRWLAGCITMLVALTAVAPNTAPAAPKPNIVYIMSDELSYFELSHMGNPRLKTPNLDRMAEEGVRFTQALAGCTVCAPTRCTLMTGKHMGHVSVRKNDGGTPMRAGEETIASMLKQAGYATGGFGKWGCGGRGSTGVPEKHGFDVFVGYYDQVHAHSFYPPYIVRNSAELPLKGNRGGRSGETYSHYVIFDEARKFLRENRDRPFFCYLPITPPHGMYDIPADDPSMRLFQDEPWPEEARRYAAMVHLVDRNVGELLAMLKEFGIEDRTIVFFSGDNGGHERFRDKDHPHGFFGPNLNPRTGLVFRGAKGNLYEGGLRIPMIVRWPGKIQSGRVSDLLWYFPDVLPTVAEITGAKAPADIDGLSILPELIGEKAAGRPQKQHEYLYWEYGGQTAVRMKNWKAIRPGPKAPWELYDLDRDLGETTNLAAQQPDILNRLKDYAAQAHQPAEEGTFHDRALHVQDQKAKWGDTQQPAATPAKVNEWPTEGLIPAKELKIVRVSSESKFNSRLAGHAIDGDPRTLWHTEFQPNLAKHPHELVIDLGAVRTVRGFRYLARQDGGWNGTIKAGEFQIGDDPEKFDQPPIKAEFKQVREAQEVKCPPVKGRYVRLRALSETGGNAWTSVAELGIVGE